MITEQLKELFSLRRFKRYPTLEQIEEKAGVKNTAKCSLCDHLLSDHYMPPGTGSDVIEYCRKEDEQGNRICKCFRVY